MDAEIKALLARVRREGRREYEKNPVVEQEVSRLMKAARNMSAKGGRAFADDSVIADTEALLSAATSDEWRVLVAKNPVVRQAVVSILMSAKQRLRAHAALVQSRAAMVDSTIKAIMRASR